MQKLDRLVWTAGLSFVSHGSRIGIRTSDASLLDRFLTLLPPGSAASGSPVDYLYSVIAGADVPNSRIRRYNLLYAGSTQAARTMDREAVFRVFEEHVHFAVALQSPRRLFVRASVVGCGGRAVVLLGDDRARMGVTIDLLDAGAVYYSNMYAVFDRHGHIHPYPTPLARGSSHSLEAGPGPQRSAGRSIRRRPLPVGLIAVVGGGPGPVASRLELSSGQATLALLGHTVACRLRPRFALEMLRRPVSAAVALDLRGRHQEEQLAHVTRRLSPEKGADSCTRAPVKTT